MWTADAGWDKAADRPTLQKDEKKTIGWHWRRARQCLCTLDVD
jgi:hypothetical protein